MITRLLKLVQLACVAFVAHGVGGFSILWAGAWSVAIFIRRYCKKVRKYLQLIRFNVLTPNSWRWALWEILWMSGPIFGVMFFFLPETSADNILLRRAKRLRKLTGNPKIHSQTEIDRKGIKFSSILADALIKPIEIMIKDPAVLFTNVYTSLVYGIYYSFFEVFPLVYPPIYGFNLGLTGTAFVCIIVACVLGAAIYIAYLYFYLIPDILKNGLRAQESRLVPALFAVFGPVIGLFLFGKWYSVFAE